jgi:hypothetical protein
VAIASKWISGKAWLGKWLIKCGSLLTHDLDENNKKRINLAVDTVIALLGEPGK